MKDSMEIVGARRVVGLSVADTLKRAEAGRARPEGDPSRPTEVAG